MADDIIFREIAPNERNAIWLSLRSCNKDGYNQVKGWYSQSNQRWNTLAVTVDYSKAFDTVY